jgi:motility quorum-sensing regulator / GCU-specific mRNA interferase toxin
VSIKSRPHHDLAAVKARFASVETLEITGKATKDAQALGYSLEDIVEVVQALKPSDFVKSETAHSPPDSKVWHDTLRRAAAVSEICWSNAYRCHVDVVQRGFS